MTIIPHIEPKKPKKKCQNCYWFRVFDWLFIERMLREVKANSIVVKQYKNVYTGPNGRCGARGCIMHNQDYCPQWKERTDDHLPPWPKDKEEFQKLLEPLIKGDK